MRCRPGVLPVGSSGLGPLVFTIDGNRGGQSNEVIGAGPDREFLGYVDVELFFGSSFLQVSFPSAIQAFGADFQSTTTADALTVTVGSGPDTVLFGDYLGYGVGDGFLGLVSSVPFSSVTFSVEEISVFAGEGFIMDDPTYGLAVPEPSTLALLGANLLALARRTKRR